MNIYSKHRCLSLGLAIGMACSTAHAGLIGGDVNYVIGDGEQVYWNESFTINHQSTFNNGGSLLINRKVTFTDGEIDQVSNGLVTFTGRASWTDASDSSHVDGAVKRLATTDFVFPTGDQGKIGQLTLFNANEVDVTTNYIYTNPRTAIGDNYDKTVARISTKEYWSMNYSSNPGSSTVGLHWEDADSDIANLTHSTDDLLVTAWNGSKWISLGRSSFNGNGDEGQVSSDPNDISAYTHFTIGVANNPPKFTSNTTFEADENQVTSFDLNSEDDYDTEGSGLSYSVAGADGALFTINASTGLLSFINAPDFEAPADSNKDNVYNLTVTVCDSSNYCTDQAVTINVKDVDEAHAPMLTSGTQFTIVEGNTAVTTLTATDPDNDPLTFSIIGGVDNALFNLNPTTGALSFITAPSFDAPTDANKDQIYEIEVQVADGNGGTSTQLIFVTVIDNTGNNKLRVNIKALLQGAYLSQDQLMKTTLHSKGIIPDNQPYNTASFGYKGTETFSNQAKNLTGSQTIVDWVLVELQNTSQHTVARKAAMLRSDGMVVDADTGIAPLSFDKIPAGVYHVRIDHRNHLGVITANPIAISTNPNDTALVNFADADTNVLGGDSARKVDTTPNSNVPALLWAGDSSQDHQVIIRSNNNDADHIGTSVLLAPGNSGRFNANYILNGYAVTDINMDGRTIYSGPQNDLNLMIFNVLMHPENPNSNSNFIMQGY